MVELIYKYDPVQKFIYTLFVILCCYLNDPQLCFLFNDSCSWVPCLSWTVKLPAVLQKTLQVPKIIWFSSIFCKVYVNFWLQL